MTDIFQKLRILQYNIYKSKEIKLIESLRKKKLENRITESLKKINLKKNRRNLLIMQPAIHSNRFDQMNAIGATSMNNQNAINAFLTSFAKIKIKMNTKMNKIRKFYESKKKNLKKIMP